LGVTSPPHSRPRIVDREGEACVSQHLGHGAIARADLAASRVQHEDAGRVIHRF
jgi:hypothetical protein